MRILGVIFLFIGLSTFFSCSDSTTIGTEVINQDIANIEVLDTFTVSTATVRHDSLLVYTQNAQTSDYLLGNFVDPIFGTVKSDLFMQFRIVITNPPSYDDTDQLDSLVLRLDYDKSDFYGDTLLEQSYTIHEIINTPNNDTSFYATDALELDPTPIANFNLVPNFVDSVVLSTSDTTTGRFTPHFSLVLPETFGNDLMGIESTQYSSNEDFLSSFGGLAIKANNPIEQMASFNLTSSISGLYLYYRDSSNTRKQYTYDIDIASVRFANFDKEESTTIVDAVNGGTEAGKDLLYLQGMNGTNVSVKLPYIKDLTDVVINNATLSFVVRPNDNEDQLDPVAQIVAYYKDENGEDVLIEDFVNAFNYGSQGVSGGTVESFTTDNGETLNRYEINIAGHLQEMIANDNIPNEIILSVSQRAQKANRVVLYGSEHPEYPVKLNIHLTNLK